MKRAVLLCLVCLVPALTLLAASPAAALVPCGESGWWWLSPRPQGNDLLDVVTVSPTVGWAVGGGTVLKTTNQGRTWKGVDTGTDTPVSSVSFTDPLNGWLAAGDSVLHTSDGGATWQELPTPEGIYRIEATGSTLWARGSHSVGSKDYYDILRSSDEGASWQTMYSGQRYLSSLSCSGPNNVWAAAGGVSGNSTLVRTTDGGATWTQLPSPTGTSFTRAIAFVDALHGWAVGDCWAVYATSDGGLSWSPQTLPAGDPAAGLAAVDFVDSTHGTVAGRGRILQTDDGGLTWTQVVKTPYGGIYACANWDSTDAICVGQYGLIMSSRSGVWSRQGGAPLDLSKLAAADENHIWGLDSEGSKIFASTDAGIRWSTQWDPSKYMGLAAISAANDRQVSAVGWNSLAIATADGGATWVTADCGTSTALSDVSLMPDGTGYAVGTSQTTDDRGWPMSQSTVLKTNDGGMTWQTCRTADEEGLEVVEAQGPSLVVAAGHDVRAVSRYWEYDDDPPQWYYGYSVTAKVIVSNDGGSTWTSCTIPLTGQMGWWDPSCFTDIAFADDHRGVALATPSFVEDQPSSIWLTTDGGRSWEQTDSCGVALESVAWRSSSEAWAVGHSHTMLHTTDGGASWQPVSSGTLLSFESVAFADSGRGWLSGTYGPYSSDAALLTMGDLAIDTTPPVTTDDTDAAWHSAPVTVTFTAADPNLPDASDVAYTEYSLDNGTTWTKGTSVTVPAPADHTGDGLQTILYRSADNDGNVEATKSVEVKIDTTSPTTTDDADAAWHNTPVTVTFTATDPNMPDASGVASTEYSLDGGTTWTKGTAVTIPAPADHTGDGLHTIVYRSTDNAGNSEAAQGCTVKIDTASPVISVAYLSVSRPHHHSGRVASRNSLARGHHGSWHTWGHQAGRLSLIYRIDDNLSPTVDVTIELVSRRGKVLQTISLGQCPTGVVRVCRLRGKLPRGVCCLRLSATDLAGNTQSKLADQRPFMHH